MTLFVNACIGNRSRTEQIARAYLQKCTDVTEVCLEGTYIEPLDQEIMRNRDQFISRGDFSHSYFENARTFANADEIVIAAPFWDLSFPAKLWIYLENVCIEGLAFRYSEQGRPIGMCKAKKLTYITTSGGTYLPDFSYNYLSKFAPDFLGIRETHLIYAENLDIVGIDPQKNVREYIQRYCG